MAVNSRSQHASPRQKFQAHVRTLSDNSSTTSRDVSPPSPRRSPDLKHVSSLRVQTRDSPPRPPRLRSIFKFGDDLDSATDGSSEPQFMTEEREVWGGMSPLNLRRWPSGNVYSFQPPEPESPVRQPSKHMRELRPFAALAGHLDTNERPKTSRGTDANRSSLTLDDYNHNDNEGQDSRSRSSKFAEGSMNTRSAGTSSTWADHGSISSFSGAESENECTPRASPQRPSVEMDEFMPAAVTPATFRQRLFKIGSAFKPSEKTKQIETDPQVEKKRKGLRKSISMWNIHNIGGKMKTRGASTDVLSPEGLPATFNHDDASALLNERKRRAEEAYARQFGSKRRKSSSGEPTLTDEYKSSKIPAAMRAQPVSRRERETPTISTRVSRNSSVGVTTDPEVSDGYSDIDHHKRPSRRELEKENQQLRAMLKQKKDQRNSMGATTVRSVPSVPSSAPLNQKPETEHVPNPTTRKSSGSKQVPERVGENIPPVPPIPERVALRTLSNTSNQSSNKNNPISINVKPPPNDAGVLSADAFGVPRPVSTIFEEDEESAEDKTPTPSPRNRRRLEPSSIEKLKVRDHITLQLKGVRREQWEWPEDVF